MAPKARMRQANKLNEAKVTKRGKIPTTLVSKISFWKYFWGKYRCNFGIRDDFSNENSLANEY